MTATAAGPSSAFESSTFDRSLSIAVDDDIGAASISPAGRDIVLASKHGLRIIDIDSPYSLPLFIANPSPWDVADVQWSPFAARAEWIASTRNQLALVYNLSMPYNHSKAPVEYTLRAHERAITDINFSAHHPDLLATCGVDSFVFVHDLRLRKAPLKLADFQAGATQVKWNRQNDKIVASAHDKYLHIWDTRRGATPLTTISAHSTKIYGIDWNRNDPHKIMTCSLDTTIKLWDNVGVTRDISTPKRVIHTHYPVWRARHTPFNHGILAMPQRGSASLWLYKHAEDDDQTAYTNHSAHEFQGHQPDAQVREFLWRSRGSTDNGIDNRDFQLVSWGTDKQLYLHRLSPELLKSALNHKRGDPLVSEPSTSRRGASYISYINGPTSTTTTSVNDDAGILRSQRKGNLSTLLQNFSNLDVFPSQGHSQNHLHFHSQFQTRETMTAQPIRRNSPRVVTHITWMDGVKFSDRHNNTDDARARSIPHNRGDKHQYQDQNDLGGEISHVGNKYKKLTFEHIDVPQRYITVSFYGPWGEFDASTEDLKLVFLRLTIKFPIGYPNFVKSVHPGLPPSRTLTTLDIEFERTTASISKEIQDDLIDTMNTIAESCAAQQREALEAVLSFALGERALDDGLHFIDDNHTIDDLGPIPGAESSSEDDEHEGEYADDAMPSTHTNANVPLAVQCTVRFSLCGFLVVARIPSAKTTFSLEAVQMRIAKNLRNGPTKDDIFDSLGRFANQQVEDSVVASSASSSTGSWEASSSPSSSSASDHAANVHIGRFQPPLAWQKAGARHQFRNSLPSSSGVGKPPAKTRCIVSILHEAIDSLVPSKQVLAKDYRIFGPGPEVCNHNSVVAKRHGFEDLADIWILCGLVLNNEVPLEILPQTHRRDQILVLARRALVRIKRKDSGLDLQFDEADPVTNPKLKGRTKWGDHAVVTWLIPALFDHFERLADVQMLAMLSCVFAEPAAREGVTSAMAKTRQSQLPMSMEAPAFSLDYFSSQDAAWSLFRPTVSMAPTPSHSRLAIPANEAVRQKLATKKVDTYGSHGSSNGPWGSDTINSESLAPYSTEYTPPISSRTSTSRSAQTATPTPYSTSPEQSYSNFKRASTTNFATAMAALSRPFANASSSSPPVKARIDDLSTSAPAGGVTWGTTTFYGGDTRAQPNAAPCYSKHTKRASFGPLDRFHINCFSDSDSEFDGASEDDEDTFDGSTEHNTPGARTKGDADAHAGFVKVTLKNQNQFDDEACVSKPLLDMSKDWLYRAWRRQYAEMLGCWGLVSEKAEVLKFNGLVSYFPAEHSRNGSRASSGDLALNRDSDEDESSIMQRVSKASSTLVPPSLKTGRSKAHTIAPPRLFSLNPEATEFQPTTVALTAMEGTVSALDAPDAFEDHLRITIPKLLSSRGHDGSFAGMDNSWSDKKLQLPLGKASRPSMSRENSNASHTSFWGVERLATNVQSTARARELKVATVYSCSICWLRICGCFFLCPTCGHVAHFGCMDDELGMDDGECVVGCSCGCGLEVDDERSRMEAYLEEVRAAHASGTAWEEANEWPHGPSNDQVASPDLLPEGSHGEVMTGGGGKMAETSSEDGRGARLVAGRNAVIVTDTSATWVVRKKEKPRSKKKTQASGLSYH